MPDTTEFTEVGQQPVVPTEYGWAPGLQRKFVALCLYDVPAYGQLGPQVFNHKLVTHPPLRLIATELFQSCHDNGGVPPSPELFEELLNDRLTTVKPAMADAVRTEWRLIATTDLSDAPLLKSKGAEWARDSALARAVLESAKIAERGSGNGRGLQILTLVQDALAVGQQAVRPMSMVHDTNEIKAALTRDIVRLPTGMPMIDQSMHGGAEVGLHVVAGDPKLGKTSFMTQLSIGACQRGYTVWQVSGEVVREAMIHRFVRGMTGMSVSEVKGDPTRAMRLLKSYQQTGGDILLDYQPGFTVPWMTSRLRMFESLGHRVDLIIADYIDIMGADQVYGERRHELEKICNALRKLATDVGIPIWTAKAVNRKAVSKPIVTKADLGECFAVAYIADNILALCATDEERRNTRMVGGRVVKAPIIRVFYATGRDLPDEYVIGAYERDNDRQRWRELPHYVLQSQDSGGTSPPKSNGGE